MNIGIVGIGNIGKELYEKVINRGWEVGFISNSKGVYSGLDQKSRFDSWNEACHEINLAFLAIPTYDSGQTAFSLINEFIDRRIPVVTCEKGAMADYYAELKSKRHLIGYTAAVGGGTKMLSHIKFHKPEKIAEIHGIINGTLNYLFRGDDIEKRAIEAKKMGLPEPGADSILQIIKQESEYDVPKKASILFNESGISSNILKSSEIVRKRELTNEHLEQLVTEPERRRFVVSITRNNQNDKDYIGGFSHTIDGWNINAGFKKLSGKDEIAHLKPQGLCNTLYILNDKGQYYCVNGPGTGPDATTDVMIEDAINIIRRL